MDELDKMKFLLRQLPSIYGKELHSQVLTAVAELVQSVAQLLALALEKNTLQLYVLYLVFLDYIILRLYYLNVKLS